MKLNFKKTAIFNAIFNKTVSIVIAILYGIWKYLQLKSTSEMVADSFEGQEKFVLNVSFFDFLVSFVVVGYLLIMIFRKKKNNENE